MKDRSNRLMLVGGILAVVALFLVAASARAESGSLRTRIAGAAEQWVAERVTAPNDSLAVAVDVPVLSVKAGEVTGFDFDLMSSKPLRGTLPLKVTLYTKAGGPLAVAATARVRLFDTVAVTARRLRRHEMLSRDDVRLERRDVTLLPDGYFTEASDLVGYRTRRVIALGRLVGMSDVEIVPLIERGTGVSVSVVIGAVIVTSKAKALEDGDLGELIKVQDLITGKRLIGTVAGKRLVILDKSML